MLPQCKGKDLNKVPKSKLLRDNYYLSVKYDGNYCQIHKKGDSVTIYTSGGKEIKLLDLEHDLVKLYPDTDFILEAEFIGMSSGKKGDRTKCGMLTTWRTLHAKGLPCYCLDNKFKIFDAIIFTIDFEDRLEFLRSLELPEQLQLVDYTGEVTLEDAEDIAKVFVRDGWEGAYIKHKSHIQNPGKRVNDAIKLKYRPTADLLCIGIEWGDGKYIGQIGSLILRDSEDREVKVGSGLSDYLRTKTPDYFINKIVEIEYEQILSTYIQPTFIGIREDKEIGD